MASASASKVAVNQATTILSPKPTRRAKILDRQLCESPADVNNWSFCCDSPTCDYCLKPELLAKITDAPFCESPTSYLPSEVPTETAQYPFCDSPDCIYCLTPKVPRSSLSLSTSVFESSQFSPWFTEPICQSPTSYHRPEVPAEVARYPFCDSPDCIYCLTPLVPRSPLSLGTTLVGSSQFSPWSTAPNSPLTAINPMPLSEGPRSRECSPLVHEFMNDARTRATAFISPQDTTVSDFCDRLDTALLAAIAESSTQLATPNVASPTLTPEEQAEFDSELSWDREYEKMEEKIERADASTESLFEELSSSIDELEAADAPIPNCSELTTWKSNAGYALAECSAKGKQASTENETAPTGLTKKSTIKDSASPKATSKHQPKSNDTPVWHNLFKAEVRYAWKF